MERSPFSALLVLLAASAAAVAVSAAAIPDGGVAANGRALLVPRTYSSAAKDPKKPVSTAKKPVAASKDRKLLQAADAMQAAEEQELAPSRALLVPRTYSNAAKDPKKPVSTAKKPGAASKDRKLLQAADAMQAAGDAEEQELAPGRALLVPRTYQSASKDPKKPVASAKKPGASSKDRRLLHAQAQELLAPGRALLVPRTYQSASKDPKKPAASAKKPGASSKDRKL